MLTKKPRGQGELEALGLPRRTAIFLGREGIDTVEQLTALTAVELANLHGIGPGRLEQIALVLSEANLALRSEKDPDGEPTEWTVTALELGGRATNRLLAARIHTVGDLVNHTFEDLLALPNVDYMTVKTIEEQLDKVVSLTLAPTTDPQMLRFREARRRVFEHQWRRTHAPDGTWPTWAAAVGP